MTSKNWFFSGMIEELKRRLWAVALCFVIFFFSLPVVMVYCTTRNEELLTQPEREALVGDVLSLLSYRNGWIIFLMTVLAVVLGVSGFAYLNSRRKVDFYHSLPIRREKWFVIHYVSGLLIVAVPYGLFAALSAQIGAMAGAPFGEAMGTALTGWAYHMLSFLILYTTAVIAVLMTGNTIVGLLGFWVFNTYFPIFLLLWQALAELCLDTFCGFDSLIGWVRKTSPFAYYISGFDGDITPGKIGSRIVVGAVLILIAAVLHKKRPSEAAGKAMTFSLSQPVIRILIVVEAAVAGLLFFWSLGGNMGWAIFGLLTGGVISHCVIEIIYHFDFKKLFSHKWQMVFSLAAAFGVFAGFHWDLTGYDSWIPKEENVASVSVFPSYEIDGWMDYGWIEEKDGWFRWHAQGSLDRVLEDVSLADKTLALDLAKTWVGQQGQGQAVRTDAAMENGASSWIVGTSWRTQMYEAPVYVEYRLESGKIARRKYQFPEGQLSGLLAAVYEDPGYKEGRYPLLGMDPAAVKDVQVSVCGEETRLAGEKGISRQELSGLLKAYQADLADMTLADSQASAEAEIRFLDEARLKMVDGEGEYYTWSYGDSEFYPVYPTFTRTLAALQELGVNLEPEMDLAAVYSILVDAEFPREPEVSQEGEIATEFYGQRSLSYEETDREMMKRIFGEMLYGPYRRYRNLWTDENQVNTRVNILAGAVGDEFSEEYGDYEQAEDGVTYYPVNYYVEDGALAEELRAKILERWNS